MSNPIRLLIADGHPVVLAGLASMIARSGDIQIVGQADDGVDVIERATELKPDVAMFDLRMRCKSGYELIRGVRQGSPSTRILIFTEFDDDDHVFFSIGLGITGYLLKDTSDDALLHAIRTVAAGETTLHPKIARKVLQRVRDTSTAELRREALTERELQVLILVSYGYGNQQIARELNISERTARTHVSNILDKLRLENRTQATLYALRAGLVRLEMIQLNMLPTVS